MSTFDPQLAPSGGRTKPRRLRLWARMLIACVIVVAASAATVATGSLLEVKTFTDFLKQSPKLNLGNELATANPGGPQTLLLIGSDKRAKGAVDASGPAHSDTMLLVRLDPNQPDTTMLSIPRDLKIKIQGYKGEQKINAAYTLGGAKLTVKTVKRVLGLQINHVVDINFVGFEDAVNYLGCVYVQVDRRYFNDNHPPVASPTPYATIDIQPGYQRLCGSNALDYVRFRHLDTDLVRSARQQDFLRQIKNQLGTNGLISRRYGLERIFGKYASTDIRSQDDVLKLLELLVQSAGHPVRQVTFKSVLGPSYVTASPQQIRATVHEFLSGGIAPARISVPVPSAHRAKRPVVPMIPATSHDIGQATIQVPNLPFKIYYPMKEVTTALATPDAFRTYRLHGHHAYVAVVAQGQLGQYYDVQGTDWKNPPILNNPNQKVQLGARKFQLYFEGHRLRMVAWRDGPGVYWVVNTLQNILTNDQMLAIAQVTRPLR
jgi:LCP family protein required for cell wall assembly